MLWESVTKPDRSSSVSLGCAIGAGQDNAEGGELIEPLAKSLGVSGAVLSLHFDEQAPPIILNRLGSAACDDGVAEGVLIHAASLHEDGPARGDVAVERGWLGSFKNGGPILSVPFRSKRGHSRIVFSGLFGPGALPDEKMIAAALRRLTPMLDAYYRLWQQHRLETRQNKGLRGALDAVDLGIVLLDNGGDLVFANAVATAILAEKRLLRRRGRTLSATQLSDTMKLQTAISMVIGANVEGVVCARAPALLKFGEGDDQLIVSALPAEQPATEAGATAAMLILLRPGGEAEKMVAPVCRLYGLSVVETRLACQIIAGRSLCEASEAMRIKEQTARSYLKQIFVKTDVNRQADLIRLLLSSVVRTHVRI